MHAQYHLVSEQQQHTSREGYSHRERRLFAHADRRLAVSTSAKSSGKSVKPAGCFLQLAILRPTNLFSRQKTPHSFLTEPPALVSAVRWPAIYLQSQDTTPTKNEEYQGIKTIFLIFLQPCCQQYREFSSPDAQLHGQGRL